jgi:hypothetical protein
MIGSMVNVQYRGRDPTRISLEAGTPTSPIGAERNYYPFSAWECDFQRELMAGLTVKCDINLSMFDLSLEGTLGKWVPASQPPDSKGPEPLGSS